VHLIAFITEGTQIRKILDHIGVDSQPPRRSPACGPPLWVNPAPGMRVAPEITLLSSTFEDRIGEENSRRCESARVFCFRTTKNARN
jgi:hypothetical protein